MAKPKKPTKKPSVNVQDLEPEADPKGGAGYLKITSPDYKLSSPTLKIEDSLNLTNTLSSKSLKMHK